MARVACLNCGDINWTVVSLHTETFTYDAEDNEVDWNGDEEFVEHLQVYCNGCGSIAPSESNNLNLPSGLGSGFEGIGHVMDDLGPELIRKQFLQELEASLQSRSQEAT